MPPETIEDQLKKVLQAKKEVDETLRELHSERKATRELIKQNRKAVDDAIQQEVRTQIGRIAEDISTAMVNEAVLVMERLERDWREKLGLPQRKK